MAREETTWRRRDELDEKITQDGELLSFVKSRLEKSDMLTRDMVSILTSFNKRLERLENSVIPTDDHTSLLQLKATVHKTLFHLDDAISHYQAIRNTDKILLLGPAGWLHDYLDSLQQIKRAVEFFQEVDPDGPELNTLNVKLERARSSMESEFGHIVGRYCTTPTDDILKMLAAESTGGDTVELIPKTGLRDLNSIYTWLTEYTDLDDNNMSIFSSTPEERRCREENIAVSPQSIGHVKTACKLDTLDRNSQYFVKPVATSSSFTKKSLKTFCSFKSLSRDQALRPNSQTSLLLETSRPSTKDPTLRSRCSLNILLPERSLSTVKACTLDSLRTVQLSNSLTKMAALNKLKTMSLERNPFTKTKVQEPFNPMSVYASKRSVWFNNAMKGLKAHYHNRGMSKVSLRSPAMQTKHVVMESPSKKTKRTGRECMFGVEIDVFIECVGAFLSLAKGEHAMLTQIFWECCLQTFKSIIQEALNNLLLSGEGILFSTKRACDRHEYSVVLTVLPVLRYLRNQRRHSSVLQVLCQSGKVNTFIESMSEVVIKGLEEFAVYIKDNPDKESMPRDGTVHELNRNAVLFLQQLVDRADSATPVRPPREAGSGSAAEASWAVLDVPLEPGKGVFEAVSGSTDEEQIKILGNFEIPTYVCKVLDNLQLNLRTKAKLYEDPALSAIFLLNNYNYILKSLMKSQLLDAVKIPDRDPEAEYRKLIDEQTQLYQRSWLKVTEGLADKSLPTLKQGDKLKEKDSQLIKDKVMGFNQALEEVVKAQRGWTVPDEEQRAALCHAQKLRVSEAYRAFLHRYGDTYFTKHPERYLKYNPETLEQMIDTLFDTSA